MNSRWLTVLLGPAVLTTNLSAQQPQLVFPRNDARGEHRLFTQVQLERPTIVILIDASLEDLGTLELKAQLRSADSLIKTLQNIADQRGYIFAIRAATHAAISDRWFNAHYAASQTTTGPAMVIARPGSTPRLLRYWPESERLDEELKDYALVFRPLVPM
jgi:hypothetical protein